MCGRRRPGIEADGDPLARLGLWRRKNVRFRGW
jgi:hypothetical protein